MVIHRLHVSSAACSYTWMLYKRWRNLWDSFEERLCVPFWENLTFFLDLQRKRCIWPGNVCLEASTVGRVQLLTTFWHYFYHLIGKDFACSNCIHAAICLRPVVSNVDLSLRWGPMAAHPGNKWSFSKKLYFRAVLAKTSTYVWSSKHQLLYPAPALPHCETWTPGPPYLPLTFASVSACCCKRSVDNAKIHYSEGTLAMLFIVLFYYRWSVAAVPSPL